jgi:xylan 1,4-beta-xylosidase
MPKLELHFTEWSSAYTPTDYMHDQYHQASFILDKIKHGSPYVDSMSYWTFTDIFEEGGPRFTPFHGGFGLINYQGIHKPAFYAYQYLSRLGTADVASSDPQTWITKTGENKIQILFWDYSPQVPPQGQNDQTYYKQNLPAKDKGNVRVTLSHLASGQYARQIYRIGYGLNDAFSDYLAIGAPSQLTPAQVRFLKEKDSGAPVLQDSVTVTGGTWTDTFPIRTNDVYEIVLRKISDKQ